MSPTTRRSPPSPVMLPPTPLTSSPSPPTSPAPEPQLSPRTPARRASPALVAAELCAQAVECRTTVAAHLTAKADEGRLTGADLFFLALKASTAYRPCARPARMRARGVRVRMWQTHPFVCRFSVFVCLMCKRGAGCQEYIEPESDGGRKVWHRSDFVVRIPSWFEFMMMG